MSPFPLFLFSFAVTFLLCPSVRRLALRIGAVDVPRGRHAHTAPTPRLGGLAVAGGMLVCLLIYRDGASVSPSLLWGGIVIVVLGLWDDSKGVPPLWKLAGQATAALLALNHYKV